MLRPATIIQERYEILSLIGQGGAGMVYEAIDLRLRHRVAIKIVPLADASAPSSPPDAQPSPNWRAAAGGRHHP